MQTTLVTRASSLALAVLLGACSGGSGDGEGLGVAINEGPPVVVTWTGARGTVAKVDLFECNSCTDEGRCGGQLGQPGSQRAMTKDCLSSPVTLTDQPLTTGKAYAVFMSEPIDASDCSKGSRLREQHCFIAR
jgi:hypothetical protein